MVAERQAEESQDGSERGCRMKKAQVSAKLIELADFFAAYDGARADIVRQEISLSEMIGSRGHLIRLHNDRSEPEAVRESARRAAGSVVLVWGGRLAPAIAANRLRIEAGKITADTEDGSEIAHASLGPNDLDERFADTALAYWFGVKSRTIRLWRKNHGFPQSPASTKEVLNWCKRSDFAINNKKSPYQMPSKSGNSRKH